jgi:hypothetical protein
MPSWDLPSSPGPASSQPALAVVKTGRACFSGLRCRRCANRPNRFGIPCTRQELAEVHLRRPVALLQRLEDSPKMRCLNVGSARSNSRTCRLHTDVTRSADAPERPRALSRFAGSLMADADERPRPSSGEPRGQNLPCALARRRRPRPPARNAVFSLWWLDPARRRSSSLSWASGKTRAGAAKAAEERSNGGGAVGVERT